MSVYAPPILSPTASSRACRGISTPSPMPRTFWVYLLASRSRALYVGMTNDLARRITEHWAGLSTHTGKYRIDRLVYMEEHPTARDAIAREKQIKAWRREKKGALVESENPTWRDLEPSRYAHTSETPSTSSFRTPRLRSGQAPVRNPDAPRSTSALGSAAALAPRRRDPSAPLGMTRGESEAGPESLDAARGKRSREARDGEGKRDGEGSTDEEAS